MTTMSESARWERARVDLLRWAPKRAYTKLVGWLADRKVPTRFRAPLYRRLSTHFGIDLTEAAEQRLDSYQSFNEVFTRRLHGGARPVDARADAVVSPCDGVVVEHGIISRGRMVQAKGRDYTLEALLCDPAEAERFEGGTYTTIYLCPADYHRVHSPVTGLISSARYVPGALFPVNPPAVRHVAGLFTVNERVVTFIDGAKGQGGSEGERTALLMVAATGVGNMTLSYAPGFRAGTRRRQRVDPAQHLPLPIERGGEVGVFNLGSTVIAIFGPGQVELEVRRGQKVRVGERIGQRRGSARQDRPERAA